MDNILVFIDWYLPGTNAGGPVRSVANVVDHLGGEFRFSIITRDTDYCATDPYPGITPDTWTPLNDHCRVHYLSSVKINRGNMRRLIRTTPFDTAWINGIYSWKFSILPLLLLKGCRKRIIVSPRGMLNPQAFTSGSMKKRVFIHLSRLLGLYRGVTFHATNEDEKENILRQVGKRASVMVAPNLARKVKSEERKVISEESKVKSEKRKVKSEESKVKSEKRKVISEEDKSEITNIQYPTPITDHRSLNTEYRIPITEYRLPNTEYRLPNTEYRLPNTEYRSPNTEHLIPKSPGSLNLISIARISPEKGTLHGLRFLKEMKEGNIHFDLYGPVYNETYWRECREVIASLPPNVTVTWHGPIDGERVGEALSMAHFLLMPTEGENFGHSILEALTAGVPVIISDRTPWRNLEIRKAGFDLPLEDAAAFNRALKQAVAMDDPEWKEMSAGALALAVEYVSDQANLEASRKLFK